MLVKKLLDLLREENFNVNKLALFNTLTYEEVVVAIVSDDEEFFFNYIENKDRILQAIKTCIGTFKLDEADPFYQLLLYCNRALNKLHDPNNNNANSQGTPTATQYLFAEPSNNLLDLFSTTTDDEIQAAPINASTSTQYLFVPSSNNLNFGSQNETRDSQTSKPRQGGTL